MKKHLFRIILVFLIIVLAVVSFYMLWVHVPYYQYHHQLDEVRNEICENNHYEYMGYFTEHRGENVYYILKVKIDGVLSYVAYDQDKKLVNTYQGDVVDVEKVKSSIMEKYKDEVTKEDIETLDIGYENDKFVYYVKVQKNEQLIYIYYDLSTGHFLKAYKIGTGI